MKQDIFGSVWTSDASSLTVPGTTSCTQSFRTSSQLPHTVGEPREKMQLVHYVVLDRTPEVLEAGAEEGILLTGDALIAGSDQTAVLLELSHRLGVVLEKHNQRRSRLTTNNAQGAPQPLKPLRIGQLEVVLQVVKTWT